MAALKCDICGGKLVAKSGGIFECDSCGMEYDKTRVQEMVQEIKGTVKVEGTVQVAGTVRVAGPVKVDGPVQVDGVSTLANHIKRGNMALSDRRWNDAILAFELALGVDVECAEAHLGKYLAKHKISSRNSLANKYFTDLYRKVIYSPANSFDVNEVRRIRKFAKGELAQWFADCDAIIKAENTAAKSAKEALQVKLAQDTVALEPVRNQIQKVHGRILAISGSHAVGLRSDGTVLATGDNGYGQCDVQDWFDVIAVAAKGNHTIGLHKNGTVVAVGDNRRGQCDVEDWSDIVAVTAGYNHTVGLKRDGTVVAVGENEDGRCDVGRWSGITAIAAGDNFTLGVSADGTVYKAGKDHWQVYKYIDWSGIISLAADAHEFVGLRANGSVTGRRDCTKWTEIVAVAVSQYAAFGLKVDGTVLNSQQSQYQNVPCEAVKEWKDIVAISAAYKGVMGVRKDGSVVAVNDDASDKCDVSDWKLFDSFENYEQESAQQRRLASERRKQMQAATLNGEKAALSAELSSLRGLFTGKRRKELEARLAQIENELKALR